MQRSQVALAGVFPSAAADWNGGDAPVPSKAKGPQRSKHAVIGPSANGVLLDRTAARKRARITSDICAQVVAPHTTVEARMNAYETDLISSPEFALCGSYTDTVDGDVMLELWSKAKAKAASLI